MAWLSRVNFVSSDTLSFTDINNLGNDIRAWGDNVNGGGYTLSNVVLSASAGTMATVIGGTGTTSTLTLRSTSGAGTTGADIIFQAGNNGATEVMRLQNGGNVGIGTSSPSWQTTVYGTGQNTALLTDAGSKSASLFVGSSNGTVGAGGAVLLGGITVNGVTSHWAIKSIMTSTTANGTADLAFSTRAATGDTTLTEKMRIDSSGNVGIGITSVTSPSRVDIVKSVTAGNLATVRQIRVGVDSNSDYSGYVGYGVGSAGYYALMLQSYHAGVYSNVILSPEGGYVGVGIVNPSYQLQLSTDSAGKPSTNTWTIVSDSRLKTVKGEYQKGLAEICQVRPVSYEYNGKAGFVPDGKDKVSILAQELMQVFPECVDTFKGKLEEDGPEIDLYNYNGHAITFALINAIKELKAKIDILEARN